MTMVPIELINELPGLPYSRAYGEWADHVKGCELCQEVLKAHAIAGRLHDSSLLCATGAELDVALAKIMTWQHEKATLN